MGRPRDPSRRWGGRWQVLVAHGRRTAARRRPFLGGFPAGAAEAHGRSVFKVVATWRAGAPGSGTPARCLAGPGLRANTQRVRLVSN